MCSGSTQGNPVGGGEGKGKAGEGSNLKCPRGGVENYLSYLNIGKPH